MQRARAPIEAIFLDLDGTLYVEGQWIPGAVDAVRWLLQRDWPVRFITNTTTRSRQHLQRRFREQHLDVPRTWFFTPARAASRWFHQQEVLQGILALVHPDVLEDLQDLPLVSTEVADFVLIGDMDEAWSIHLLNRGLRALLNGAKLVALQRNRRWRAREGYRLDAGAFVTALEYGADVQCEMVFGKPNPVFFRMALLDVGASPERVLMVGDDVEFDVLAAQRCGMQGALVKTGKFRPEVLTTVTSSVNVVLEDVSQLPEWLQSRGDSLSPSPSPRNRAT